ncbi:hypothetical protein FQN60_003623 [Etheostoma spectabile]|uniref:Small integral membrane protein 5 n=1 Tax=Etheostoma spectabile TaxID=54343 RepID=A0A5J5CUY6_9PERO|nr:hypothetical protein FQN60_003623 [Etheostoma spectabile]
MLRELFAASASFCCFLLMALPAFVGLFTKVAAAFALALMDDVTAEGASAPVSPEPPELSLSVWAGLSMMDARQETLNILNKIWVKLQGLPNAHPIELGAFFVILTFILVVLLMTVLTCVTCCCRKTKTRGLNI